MLDRSADTYGAPFTQTETVLDPEEQQDCTQYNRHACDSAMMTIPAMNWVCSFVPTATAAPTTVLAANVTAAGLSGTGPSSKPVVTKTATGRYTLTYPSSFVDDIGTTQTVSFRYAIAAVRGSVDGRARVSAVSGNVVTVLCYNAAGALADTAEYVDVFAS